MKMYIIYRKKSDKKISKISTAPEKETLASLKEKAENWEDPERYAEINENELIGEILDYLDGRDKFTEDWKSSIKNELLDNIHRSQYELDDLEMFVSNFGDD